MRFDLHRPCPNCPFRSDVVFFLAPGRMAEIVRSLLTDQTFTCHATIDYSAWHDAGAFVPDDDNQHCAGALIMLKKADRLYDNHMFRLAVALELFKPDQLNMDSPVITLEEVQDYSSKVIDTE